MQTKFGKKGWQIIVIHQIRQSILPIKVFYCTVTKLWKSDMVGMVITQTDLYIIRNMRLPIKSFIESFDCSIRVGIE